MKTVIMIASHKKYWYPKNSKIYKPVFVGRALHENNLSGYQSDAIGDNISAKNSHYNEVTAIYWAWRNHPENIDAIGIVQYRRYFRKMNRRCLNKKDSILNDHDIEGLLQNNSIIVPRKRRYFIETIESHYRHSHQGLGLDVMRNVFKTKFPEDYPFFQTVMRRRSAHLFNMFIMRISDFDSFCSWMFPILFSIENQIDFSLLVGNEQRVMGFLNEFMLDIWLLKTKKDFIEMPVVFLEKQQLPKKMFIFLLNKFSAGHIKLNTHIH